MDVINTMERIRGAAECLSMTYEIHRRVHSQRARFLEVSKYQIESEIREAEVQEHNESHDSEFEQ
ncbi:hypothetical protein GCK32_021729, partial [Trichostrongylus colubriformis]